MINKYFKQIIFMQDNNMNINWIDCTGDACIGDYVRFRRALFEGGTFSGKYKKKPKFVGYETVEGKIIKDSYGKDKQQHTFTILKDDDTKLLIKGRNLYRNGCERITWENESERNKILEEKHQRGSQARLERDIRKNREQYEEKYSYETM